MTLLDRFRTQPQRDPDPAVRLAYLAELPLTEREQIVASAREDEDARVRKAAVGEAARSGCPGGHRRERRGRVGARRGPDDAAGLALDAFEGVDESREPCGRRRVERRARAHADRQDSLRETVARCAFDRLDANAANVMASIARQAELEPIRQVRVRAAACVVRICSGSRCSAISRRLPPPPCRG